jgi:hypothetical protein
MTELENLRVQLNKIVDAIVIEAKKQNVTVVPTLSAKQDLFEHINKSFTNLLNQPDKVKNIMTPYVNPYIWPRDNNCWAKSVNLSGYSACVLGLGGVGGGTLLTRKHVLLANHVPYAALPFTIFFVNNNNVTITYNVVKTKRVGDTDILIGELDKEADVNLSVFSVLPSNYIKYFSETSAKFPVLFSDQERKALIGDYFGVREVTYCGTNAQINSPSSEERKKYYEPVRGGDSGNMVCTIINNEPVLIGGWFQYLSEISGVCTLLPAYLSQINEVIASFGDSNYKLKVADLSNFKQF